MAVAESVWLDWLSGIGGSLGMGSISVGVAAILEPRISLEIEARLIFSTGVVVGVEVTDFFVVSAKGGFAVLGVGVIVDVGVAVSVGVLVGVEVTVFSGDNVGVLSERLTVSELSE